MTNLNNFFKATLFAASLMSAKAATAQQPSIFLADPTIFPDKGVYYLYGTGNKQGFQVYQSTDLKTWMPPQAGAPQLALQRGESFGNKGFWAPQVFTWKGSYYMAYTADEQIAIAKGPGPMGPFTQEKLTALGGTGKQIDPFIFVDDDGKIYLYHVKLQNGNRIFVTEMKPDLSDIIPGTEKECLSGTEEWENTAKSNWPVTEGPTVLKHKNLYYLIYSANDFRNKDYAVGYATAPSPTGPWKKYTGNPIISRHTIAQYGSGHGDILIDTTGKMHYVLHTHRSESTVSPRPTGIVELNFTTTRNGKDILQVNSKSFEWLKRE